MKRRGAGTIELRGAIAGVGFESGDRFVVGMWERGPLGAMVDVMWARPDGERVLLAPHEAAARFIAGVYAFDDVQVVECRAETTGAGMHRVSAGPLVLRFATGRPTWLFKVRPAILACSLVWVRVEDALLRRAVGRFVLGGAAGVRAHGMNASGVQEWYRIIDHRPIEQASASLGGRDLGAMRPVDPPVRFGFSGFPRRPALVRCAPVLEGAERYLPERHAGAGRGSTERSR